MKSIKKITLNSFPDVEVSVSFKDPAELVWKLIDSLSKGQREELFDKLEEEYHEDFAKRIVESPDFFFRDTLAKAINKEGILMVWTPVSGTKEEKKRKQRLISRVVDLIDPDNYTDPTIHKLNEEKINKLIKTLPE